MKSNSEITKINQQENNDIFFKI